MKFKKDSELPSSSGVFIRLKDGESVSGVFRGELHEFYNIWEDGKSRVALPGEGGKHRFRANFVISENGKWVAKIFEQGSKLYKALRKLSENCDDLEKTKVMISRSGSTMNDTEYSVVFVMKDQLTKEQLKEIENVELKDLGLGDTQDEIPF